jgi:hypothetical protein
VDLAGADPTPIRRIWPWLVIVAMDIRAGSFFLTFGKERKFEPSRRAMLGSLPFYPYIEIEVTALCPM